MVGRKVRCLNGATMCFFVCGCGHEGGGERELLREPTGVNVPWHVLIGRGVRLLMKCVGRFIYVHFRM